MHFFQGEGKVLIFSRINRVANYDYVFRADEEDELLYGESDFGFQDRTIKTEPIDNLSTADDTSETNQETFWLILSRDNSDLEVNAHL